MGHAQFEEADLPLPARMVWLLHTRHCNNVPAGNFLEAHDGCGSVVRGVPDRSHVARVEMALAHAGFSEPHRHRLLDLHGNVRDGESLHETKTCGGAERIDLDARQLATSERGAGEISRAALAVL